MSKICNEFDQRKILPPDIALKSADKCLQKIGLSLFRDPLTKRSKTHNPILMLIIESNFFLQFFVSLIIPEENRKQFLLIGDLGHFYKARVHCAIACCFMIQIPIFSQILHYYNYKNNIKPTYLKLFEMISGSVPPLSIGLTEREDVFRLLKISKFLFFIPKFMPIVMFFAALLFGLITYIQNLNINHPIILSIISVQSLLFGCACYYLYSIVITQLVYYHLICYYLKLKIKRINDGLKNNLKSKNGFNSAKKIRSLNKIYEEIDDYNNNYWSKFLLCIWISIVSIISTFVYLSIFREMEIINKLIVICVAVLFICFLLLVINTSSSVHSESNKTYRLLNSCIVLFKIRSTNRTRPLKVEKD
jgi:hypothetical protein